MGKHPLNIAGTSFKKGLGTHAPSQFKIDLHKSASRFQAKVGVNQDAKKGSVEFVIILDGKEKWRSGVMTVKDAAKSVDISLKGLKSMMLVVTDGGDGNDSDHADWVDATILYKGQRPSVFSLDSLFPPIKETP